MLCFSAVLRLLADFVVLEIEITALALSFFTNFHETFSRYLRRGLTNDEIGAVLFGSVRDDAPARRGHLYTPSMRVL